MRAATGDNQIVIGRPSVLCMEDYVPLAELLRFALERAGYAVQVARSSVDMLAMVAAVRPALVLLDLHVPGSDGLALCRYLRTSLHLPVILLGARAGGEDVVQTFRWGADAYIGKPFNTQVLLYRIAKVLDSTSAAALAVSGHAGGLIATV